jgi:hypothetical protein
VVLAWCRHDVVAVIRSFVSDHARPSGELALQLAILAAIALLPLVLIAALLFVVLDWIRCTIQRTIKRVVPFAVVALLALRLALVQPPPSPHMLRPRPVA